MSTLRRSLLKLSLLATGIWLMLGSAKYTIAKKKVDTSTLLAFRDFLDRLIPEDISPSATQLDLDSDLLKHAKQIENYERLIFLGCHWLDLQSHAFYKTTFVKLTEAQKDKVIEIASKSRPDSIPSQFFNRIRRDAFTFYYSKPSSWIGLNFFRPPQPNGYLDYQKSPKS